MVALAVVFARDRSTVIATSIGLHDQALIPPEEINNVGPHSSIHLGLGNVVPTTEAQERQLQRTRRAILDQGGRVDGQPANLRLPDRLT